MLSRHRLPTCLTALLIVVLLAAAGPAGANSVSENKPGPGDVAPLFSATDLAGAEVTLEGLVKSGKVVLLNFWGLRCSSCIEEIGYLNPLHEKYAAQGVVFLGVNVDGVKPETIRKLMPNMASVPRFTVLPDPDLKIPDMYSLMGAPLSFVIGRDGVVKYRHEDFKPGDEKELEEEIRKALAEK